jgi:hypothetical protein
VKVLEALLMLKSNSNFARTVVSIMGGAMMISGTFLWVVGCLGFASLGFFLVKNTFQYPSEESTGVLGSALMFILLQAYSSAMTYFGRALYNRNPEPLPGNVLPKLWFARFMKLLCFSALIFLLPPFLAHLANLRWGTVLYALAGAAVTWSFWYFERQTDQWARSSPTE